jgi:hypothetical protein
MNGRGRIRVDKGSGDLGEVIRRAKRPDIINKSGTSQAAELGQLDLGSLIIIIIISLQTLMRGASQKGNPSMRVWDILAAGGGCASPPLPRLLSLVSEFESIPRIVHHLSQLITYPQYLPLKNRVKTCLGYSHWSRMYRTTRSFDVSQNMTEDVLHRQHESLH